MGKNEKRNRGGGKLGKRRGFANRVLASREARMRTRAGYHRVRDSGGRARGDRDYRHHAFPPKAARALGRHCERYELVVRDESGQATVEYAVVLGALICVVVALGVMARAINDGLFVEHALSSASHHVQASVGWVTDVFAF